MEWIFAGLVITVVVGVGLLIGLALRDVRPPRLPGHPPEPPPYYGRRRR